MSGQRSQSREEQRIRRALDALAAQLDQTTGEVAETLHEELARALGEIDSGIAADDAAAVGRASHAARNSVLMLDDRPMLTELRNLEAGVARGDVAATNAARARVRERWERLAEVLRDV